MIYKRTFTQNTFSKAFFKAYPQPWEEVFGKIIYCKGFSNWKRICYVAHDTKMSVDIGLKTTNCIPHQFSTTNTFLANICHTKIGKWVVKSATAFLDQGCWCSFKILN